MMGRPLRRCEVCGRPSRTRLCLRCDVAGAAWGDVAEAAVREAENIVGVRRRDAGAEP